MDGAGLPRAVTSFASPDEQQSLLASLAHQNPNSVAKILPKFCSKNIAFCF
jgi:hypothetical protein